VRRRVTLAQFDPLLLKHARNGFIRSPLSRRSWL
jgi:hypothetical protein